MEHISYLSAYCGEPNSLIALNVGINHECGNHKNKIKNKNSNINNKKINKYQRKINIKIKIRLLNKLMKMYN